MTKKEIRNHVWKIKYETLASNTNEWDFSATETALGYSDPASAIELVKRSALKASWLESDENGNETNKKVTVKGFRVVGIWLESIIDIV